MNEQEIRRAARAGIDDAISDYIANNWLVILAAGLLFFFPATQPFVVVALVMRFLWWAGRGLVGYIGERRAMEAAAKPPRTEAPTAYREPQPSANGARVIGIFYFVLLFAAIAWDMIAKK